jgi:pimeloyl-ACP methyl ester carboxylesterase
VRRALLLACMFLFATLAQAQDVTTETVTVNGHAMRVRAAGLRDRKPTAPVIVLEAGAGGGLEAWGASLMALAQVAPVIAYDRAGLGQSEFDDVRPTIRHVNDALHALLQQMRVGPPYVLVGHSYGGVLIRGFANAYPTEVVGLAYIEAPDFEATRQEKAAVLPESMRTEALADPVLPPIPANTPPGLRAEIEVLAETMTNDYADARRLPGRSDIPVSVVIAAPPGRLRSPGDALMRLQLRHHRNGRSRPRTG